MYSPKDIEENTTGAVYAVSYLGELFKSTNAGENWSSLQGALSGNIFVVDRSNALICIDPNQGLVRSTDDGVAWSAFGSPEVDGVSFRSMVVHPTGTIIGASTTGIFSRWDTSATWHSTLPGFPARLIAVGGDGTTWVISSSGYLVRSQNAGLSWDSVAQVPLQFSVYSLAATAGGSLLVAEPFGGLQRSTNGGTSWFSVETLWDFPRFFTDHSHNVFAATNVGLYQAMSGGQFWASLNGSGMVSTNLTMGLRTVSGAFVVAGPAGIQVSSDDGQTWGESTDGLVATFVKGVAFDDLDDFYAASNRGVHKSTDAGDSWQLTGSGDVDATTVYWSQGGFLLTTLNGQIHRSTDRGDTWTATGPGRADHFVEASDGTIISGAVTSGILRSTDQGLSWTPANTGLPSSNVRDIDIDRNENLFAMVSYGEVYRSTNGGDSWEHRGGTGTQAALLDEMCVDSGIVLLATWPDGMIRSTDAGLTFQPVSEFDGEYVSLIGKHPDSRIFSSGTRGTYVSSDHGETWESYNNDLYPAFASQMTFSENGSALVATDGKGVFFAQGTIPNYFFFGNIMTGDSSTISVQIKNPDASAVQFDFSLSFGTSFSILDSSPIVIPAMDSAEIELAFHPVEFGEATDTLTVSSTLGVESYVLAGQSQFPILDLSASALAFDPVAKDSSASLILTVSNPSVNTLVADSIYTSTTAFDVDSVTVSLDVEEETILTITFNPPAYGAFADTLYLRNNSDTPLETIPLAGSSPAPLLSADPSLTLGPVALIDTAVGNVTLRNLSPVNGLTVSGISNMAPVFFMDPFAPFAVAGGDSETVTIRFNVESFTPEGYGTHLDTLTVTSDGGTVKIALFGHSPRPSVVVNPDPVVFETVPLYDSSDATIRITNSSVNPLIVDSIRAGTESYAVLPWTQDPVSDEDTLVVQLRFRPETFGFLYDTLSIWSNALQQPAVAALVGVCPAPVVLVRPNPIQFGQVLRDSMAQLVFTIVDSSVSRLRIDSLWTGTPYFNVTKTLADMYIQPFDTVSISIRFTPDSTRQYSDTMYVANNAEISPFKVPLMGNGIISSVGRLGTLIPDDFVLSQNYPNPFNPSTTIRFGIPVRSWVRMVIYNLLGQESAVLMDREIEAGYYEQQWVPQGASGLYFCRIEAVTLDNTETRFVDVKKLILVR